VCARRGLERDLSRRSRRLPDETRKRVYIIRNARVVTTTTTTTIVIKTTTLGYYYDIVSDGRASNEHVFDINNHVYRTTANTENWVRPASRRLMSRVAFLVGTHVVAESATNTCDVSITAIGTIN